MEQEAVLLDMRRLGWSESATTQQRVHGRDCLAWLESRDLSLLCPAFSAVGGFDSPIPTFGVTCTATMSTTVSCICGRDMVKVCTRDAVTKSVDPARDIVSEQLEKKGDDLLRNTPNMQQLTNEHVQDVMK